MVRYADFCMLRLLNSKKFVICHRRPDSGLVSNYCRNPSDWRNAWCYTKIKDSNGQLLKRFRWKDCVLPFCPESKYGGLGVSILPAIESL